MDSNGTSEGLLQDRQRAALQKLLGLAEERAQGEADYEHGHEQRTQAALAEQRATIARITEPYENAKVEIVRVYQEAQERIRTRFETDHTTTDREYRRTKHTIQTTYNEQKQKTEAEAEETRWGATAELEGRKKNVVTQREKVQYHLQQTRKRLTDLKDEAAKVVESWGKVSDVADEPAPKKAEASKPSLQQLQQQVEAVEQHLKKLKALSLPFWYKAAFAGRARTQALEVYEPFRDALAQAEDAVTQLQAVADARHKRDMAEATRQCHQTLQTAETRFESLLTRMKVKCEADLEATDAKFRKLLVQVQQQKDKDWKQNEETNQQGTKALESRFQAESQKAERDHQARLQDLNKRHEQEWRQISQRWRDGMAWVQQELESVNTECGELFPAWSDPSWAEPAFAKVVPRAIPFGQQTVRLEDVPHGVPQSDALRAMAPASFPLPSLLRFPAQAAVLYRASADGRAAAVVNLQALMLRFLTALPPAKVRFTIIDPVGLGENFAAFMHLADHDEDLVTSRIWTESQHIEQRLTDLTDHMGNVIQKYLRNEFASIEDYNQQAGEVAEPYRILVVANFPVNFSLEAARRLASIAATGSNCGVYTLVSVDTKQTLPHGFDLADLEQVSLSLAWKGKRFEWKDPDFGRYPLELEAPPDKERTTELMNRMGEKAKLAKRVEVSFEFVAPTPAEWWTQNSSTGIRVPLGRHGATGRQFLQLGKGTSQHVLIAGKTGSGKSSLLHALITNLALLYSPDEVELYLIDFKKGVEFKAYANHQLPHARVVAVESEREFGLSVLQRLDAELKERGEMFRSMGVNDLNGYRNAANGQSRCPRIMFIVDEFQEFFVEDDKLAQESSLLLDRLVRQGRAFGLHVLLGSQTLGGAYTLARSTIDQMAVRIALQCSEADAHLILSKDNAAARLLSRPGEAIYNDANGLVEGNDLFQVVWLPEDRRENYLDRLHELAVGRHLAPDGQIVFEGNAPADPRKNHLLRRILEEPAWQGVPRVVNGWMGEAIAIKDPTCAVFKPQTANNLLILGQHEEGALGIFAMTLFSLAAQLPPGEGAQFYLLDGTPADSPDADVLKQLAGELAGRAKYHTWRELPEMMNEVAAEVARREQARISDAPQIYFVIQGLQWFRELRRQEDDFGFGRRGEEKQVPPSKQLASILRDGPGVNVHVLAWCDSLTNLQRSFDRQGMREFELRVLFQMSANDSSNLIDSPLASRLGMHRALFLSDDRNIPEKFRPYGLPSPEWLAEVKQLLEKKARSETGAAVGSS